MAAGAAVPRPAARAIGAIGRRMVGSVGGEICYLANNGLEYNGLKARKVQSVCLGSIADPLHEVL